MSDLQILYDRIDLSDSLLTSHEKSKLHREVQKSVQSSQRNRSLPQSQG